MTWHPTTNLLLSASTDRGIIVWTSSANGKKYLPSLCNIKELKSNLDAAWNTQGNKFCVGASSGHVFVGHYDSVVNFWVAPSLTGDPAVSKPLHKASVLSVRFDPGSGRVVASASADGTVIISSCYDPSVDGEGTGPFAGVDAEYGTKIFSFNSKCWNNTLAFNQTGETLAFSCK